jgi:hypothetical protein
LELLLITTFFTANLVTDQTVSLSKIVSQTTGVNSALDKSLEKSINNVITSGPVNLLAPSPSQVDSLIEVQLSATEWDWKIRKVGTFATQVLIGKVSSAYDVLVDFEGFANFTDPNSGIQINTWYAISQTVPPPPNSTDWISANLLNSSDFVIPAPINGASWNLWCKIEVTQDITASEYSNNPTITFVVQGVERWFDPSLSLNERTGGIKELQTESH